jgi:hypothetical protein
LDTRNRSAWNGGGFGYQSGRRIRGWPCNSYGADTVSSILKQETKVVLFFNMGYSRLPFSQPSFRREVFEKGMKSGGPEVLAL